MQYSIEYFIEKFEAIPEELWITGHYTDNDGRYCALGHCGLRTRMLICQESDALQTLLPHTQYINDDRHPSYKQPTPKQRILAALRDKLT